jgi:DNA-binding IclR family transcriptional regulator
LSESLRTVERTLALLKLFSREVPEMSVAEIVRRSGMPRAVVQRIIVTLENEGFLERSADPRKLRVGFAACELGALHLSHSPLVQAGRDVLRRLAAESGFPVYLGNLTGSEISILAVQEGRMPIRFLWAPGDRLPIATTALGKAMLMHLATDEIDALIGSQTLPGLSPHSLRTRAELDHQLAAYAGKDWIPAFEESFPGVYAVGSAVLSAAGRPIAGVSVSFLRDESDADQVRRIGEATLDAARAVGERLASFAAYGSPAAIGPLSRISRVEAPSADATPNDRPPLPTGD